MSLLKKGGFLGLMMFVCGCGSVGVPHSLQSVTFSLTDTSSAIEANVGDRLLLRAVNNGEIGWSIVVIERPPASDSLDLLYHSLEWHGPYPSQIIAWHVAEQFFPNERRMCVRGHPYEVVVRLQEPDVAEKDGQAVFTSGTVVLEWLKKRSCARGDA